MQVERLAVTCPGIEVVGPRRLERVRLLEVLVDVVGTSRRICALEERGSNALAFVDGKPRADRWDPAGFSGPSGGPRSLYDALARFGHQIVLADGPSALVLDGLRTAAEAGCALWAGVEQQGTISAAGLVLEVDYDQACRRVWTSADGLLYDS